MTRSRTPPGKQPAPPPAAPRATEASTTPTLVDNRPETRAQRKMIRAIDGSRRVVAQRVLPSRRQITDEVGAPKANTRKIKIGLHKPRLEEKEQATHYRAVLDAVHAADTYIKGTEVGGDAGTITAQLDHILGLYDAVWDAAWAYVEAKGEKTRRSSVAKTAYMRGLMRQVSRERVVLESVAREAIRVSVRTPLGMPTWYGLMSRQGNRDRAAADTPLAAPAPVDLTGAVAGQVHGGGINQVTEFDEGGVDSFYKPEKAAIPNPDTLRGQQPQPPQAEIEAAEKEFYIAEDFGIDAAAPQLAKRDVAMARLDSLLGAGVIARAELAVRGQSTGSLLDAAGGQGRVRAGDAQVAEGNAPHGRIDLQGAGIQRMLSKLQLVDILAMQADRHMGNYYLHVDAQDRVVGVTGIDNDLSFGTRTQTTPRQEFPGISRFVDKQLAQRILGLHPDDLRWALGTLLTANEVEAAVTRLTNLQAVLKDARLLAPNEWSAATADQLWDEGLSYHKNVTREYRKTQQVANADPNY